MIKESKSVCPLVLLHLVDIEARVPRKAPNAAMIERRRQLNCGEVIAHSALCSNRQDEIRCTSRIWSTVESANTPSATGSAKFTEYSIYCRFLPIMQLFRGVRIEIH